MANRRILILIRSPHPSRSNRSLADVVASFRSLPDVVVEVWSLFGTDEHADGFVDTSHIVDELRTWRPAATLAAVGLAPVADRLRGLRLRWWWIRLRPDIVLLDDVDGGRVIPRRAHPFVVLRGDASLETLADGRRIDLMAGPGSEDPVLGEPEVRRWDRRDPVADAARRSHLRSVLGLPESVPLVAGWGDDGWLDGLDLFVRAMWRVAERAPTAHAVWFGAPEPLELDRLTSELTRCGLHGRFHLRPAAGMAGASIADVLFLSHRCESQDLDLDVARVAGAGVRVITFSSGRSIAGVTEVHRLDTDAAAHQIVDQISVDRASQAGEVVRRHDAGQWASTLLELASARPTRSEHDDRTP